MRGRAACVAFAAALLASAAAPITQETAGPVIVVETSKGAFAFETYPNDAPRTVASARLYVTAMGSYRMFLNGHAVGEDVLNPGYTDYSKRVQYQTYDVTQQVTIGKNVLGAILGAGWFGSGMTWAGQAYFFQPASVRLLAQLEIQHSDGSRDTIINNNS